METTSGPADRGAGVGAGGGGARPERDAPGRVPLDFSRISPHASLALRSRDLPYSPPRSAPFTRASLLSRPWRDLVAAITPRPAIGTPSTATLRNVLFLAAVDSCRARSLEGRTLLSRSVLGKRIEALSYHAPGSSFLNLVAWSCSQHEYANVL